MVKKVKLVPDKLSPAQRHLVNKRLSINLLIQGAASQAHLSAHYLVKNELDQIDGRLITLYDRAIAGATYAYWRGFISLVMGRANKFWRTMDRPSHPFFYHRFLRRHGRAMAEQAFETAKKRCVDKGVPTNFYRHEFSILSDIFPIIDIERDHRQYLEKLAKTACAKIIGTPEHLLNASITRTPAWGTVRTPQTHKGKLLIKAMVGWGGVDKIDGELQVVAKAIVWPLLLHELVKGSMELVCLHALGDLPSEDYNVVMDHTEHIEYEVPMIQIGPEFYLRFLSVVPREFTLAECVMMIARMEPIELEEFLFDMVETPDAATKKLIDTINDTG